LAERLENLPTPLSINLLASNPPHEEQRLDSLRTLEIVGIGGLDDNVLVSFTADITVAFFSIEVGDFRGESSSGNIVHLVAGVSEFAGETKVFFVGRRPFATTPISASLLDCRARSGTESKVAAEEANKMIHLW